MIQSGEIASAANTIRPIAESLDESAKSLADIAASMKHVAFWDTQWFAAVIGASGAILVFLIEKLITARRAAARERFEICSRLRENLSSWHPDFLLHVAEQSRTGYTSTDALTGEVIVVPERTLGDKMIAKLKEESRWWEYRDKKLRQLFDSYRHSLSLFGGLVRPDEQELRQLIVSARDAHKRIEQYVLSVTGDDSIR